MVRPLPLKVLLYTRADAEYNAGGDLVEARRLCAGLVAAGHEAVVGEAGTHHGTGWDVVHLFNIDRAAELAVFLKRHNWFEGAYVVLAPVFSTSSGRISEPLARFLRPVANLAYRSARPGRYWIPGLGLAHLRRRVDALHFHTAVEEEAFNLEYRGFSGPSAIIPPPVDDSESDALQPLELPVKGPFVAAVGRVEPLKNQLWLITSGVARTVPIVFVGPINPKRPLYGRRFVRLIRRTEGCFWLGRLDQSGVRQVLERATAQVLPSRRENFGLATLEALDTGCEAIVPEHHFIVDELGNALHTFNLGHAESLEAAVSEIVAGDQRASSFSRDRYTITAVTAAVLRLYEAASRERES